MHPRGGIGQSGDGNEAWELLDCFFWLYSIFLVSSVVLVKAAKKIQRTDGIGYTGLRREDLRLTGWTAGKG
jgi:hypothetical protein